MLVPVTVLFIDCALNVFNSPPAQKLLYAIQKRIQPDFKFLIFRQIHLQLCAHLGMSGLGRVEQVVKSVFRPVFMFSAQ